MHVMVTISMLLWIRHLRDVYFIYCSEFSWVNHCVRNRCVFDFTRDFRGKHFDFDFGCSEDAVSEWD